MGAGLLQHRASPAAAAGGTPLPGGVPPGGAPPGGRPFRPWGGSPLGRASGASLPPSYALLGHHARQAGQHIKAAAYYLASAKHSSLDLCLSNGMVSA